MDCESCGRKSITGEPKCPDCAPMVRTWPRGWLTKRLEELAEKENQ